MKVNKFNIPVLSIYGSIDEIATNNYIFNGRLPISNQRAYVYSRRINRSRFGIYIRKYEKLS